MTHRFDTAELPLLLAGVPESTKARLRVSGLPISRFDARMFATRFETLVNDNSATSPLVLFDSRNSIGQNGARDAKRAGLGTIDIAALRPDTEETGTPETECAQSTALLPLTRQRAAARFLSRLKREIENVGGLWIRIADYPYPYTCGLFSTSNPLVDGEFSQFGGAFASLDGPTEVPGVRSEKATPDTRWDDLEVHSGTLLAPPQSTDQVANTAWLKRRYVLGWPVLVRDDGRPTSGPIANTAFDHHALPLLWQTSIDEFKRWWNVRERTTFRVQKHLNIYKIVIEGSFDLFRPMIELWRGNHVATIPVYSGEMNFREEGLAFQQETRKHPAGFASQWWGVRHADAKTSQRMKQSA